MQIRELARSMDFGSNSSVAIQVGAALGVGILLGIAFLILGPIPVLLGLAGVLVIWLTFSNPEIIILVMLALALELIPPTFNLSVSLFVGHFFMTDLLMVILLTIIFIRLVADKTFLPLKTPLDVPLLLFCAAAFLGVITAVRSHGVKFSYTTPDVRIFIYYLIFFVVTNLIRTRAQLTRLVNGILLIAVLVAGTMVIQATLGRSYLIFSRASSVQGEGVVRLFNPGFVACYIALITMICDMALRKDRRSPSIRYLFILLLGVGLLATVTRNILVSLAIVLAVLVIIVRKSNLSGLASGMFALTAVAVLGIAWLTLFGWEGRLLQYASTFLDRTSRMFSGTILSSQENVTIRWEEIEYAWQHIAEHPIVGIGFRTSYRPAFYEGDLLTSFLHNAYLSIWLKTGVLGLISFLWFSLCFLLRGFRNWRNVPNSFFRAVNLGFTLAYLGLLISNFVAPTFIQDQSAMIFGVVMGIGEAALVQNEANVESKKGEFPND